MKFKIWDARDKKFLNPKKFFIGCNGRIFMLWDYDPVTTGMGEYVPLFFSGIRDKYRKRVFQGDLIKAFGEGIIEVEFYNGSFGYWVSPEKKLKYFVPLVKHAHLKIINGKCDQIEVIGNKYQGPNLKLMSTRQIAEAGTQTNF